MFGVTSFFQMPGPAGLKIIMTWFMSTFLQTLDINTHGLRDVDLFFLTLPLEVVINEMQTSASASRYGFW